MLDKFYYQNNFGEKIYFGKDGIFACYNDLRDYEWAYESSNNAVTGFSRGIKTKKLPVLFVSETGQKTRQARNKAYEIAEKDVLAGKKGKLFVNGYYMECWLYGLKNSEYLNSESYMKSEFSVLTDKPQWVKTTPFSFVPSNIQSSDDEDDFPFDYPIDLMAAPFSTNTMVNPFAFPSHFILNIYGACINPQIEIGDYTYLFNCVLTEGERLEVNSMDKTIRKYSQQGVFENYFNCRNKAKSVFEPITTGNKQIQWNSSFKFDLVLIQQRSEPEWSYTVVSASDVNSVQKVDSKYYLSDSKGEYIRDNFNEPISVETAGE